MKRSPLPLVEIAAFAARAFRNQHARPENAGGMELHKLLILQRQAGAQRHFALPSPVWVWAPVQVI